MLWHTRSMCRARRLATPRARGASAAAFRSASRPTVAPPSIAASQLKPVPVKSQRRRAILVCVPDPALKIANAAALTDVFGHWPNFHDAEVLSISLDRDGVSGSEISIAIHVFEITSEITDDGFYRLRNHTRVTLAFQGVDTVQLAGFNHQNAVHDVVLEDISARQLEWLKWQVRIESSHGVEATFLCRAIRVDDAAPFKPRPSIASP